MDPAAARPRAGFAKSQTFVDDELRDRELAPTLDMIMEARGYHRDPETGHWAP